MEGVRRMAKRASQEHQELISGELDLSDASKSAKSWVELWCYRKALEINRERGKIGRRQMFVDVPESLKSIVVKYGRMTKNRRGKQ